MNDAQTLFAVFFAIFWGTVANAQPRWRAFNLPLFDLPHVRRRLILSFTFFNVIPLLFFGWTLWILAGRATTDWTVWGIVSLILRGVIPAFTTFGFYRFWLGIVEATCSSGRFYVACQDDLPEKYRPVHAQSPPMEPSIRELGIKEHTGFKNIVFGCSYILVAWAVPLLFRIC